MKIVPTKNLVLNFNSNDYYKEDVEEKSGSGENSLFHHWLLGGGGEKGVRKQKIVWTEPSEEDELGDKSYSIGKNQMFLHIFVHI